MSMFFNPISRGIMPAIRRTAKNVRKPVARISSGRAARQPVDIYGYSKLEKLSLEHIKNNLDLFQKAAEKVRNNPFGQTAETLWHALEHNRFVQSQQRVPASVAFQPAGRIIRQAKQNFQDMAANTRDLWRILQTPKDRRALLSNNLLGRVPRPPARPALPTASQNPISPKPFGAPPFWPAGPQKRLAESLPWTPQAMPNAKRARTQPPPSPPLHATKTTSAVHSASTDAPSSPFHTPTGKKPATTGIASSTTSSMPKRTLEPDSPFNIKRQRITADPSPFTLPARLEDITFQQQNGYSCYVLSALDGLLHHPQGRQVLSRIQIQPDSAGYLVKFPAQKEAIRVTHADLTHPETVKASHAIVPIIEQASLKIPGVERGKYDNLQSAVTRIFGESPTGNMDLRTLDQSLGQARKPGGPVKLWTAMKIHGEGSNKAPGEHYYSIRMSRSKPGHVTVSNPFKSEESQTMPLSEFEKTFVVENTDIPHG